MKQKLSSGQTIYVCKQDRKQVQVFPAKVISYFKSSHIIAEPLQGGDRFTINSTYQWDLDPEEAIANYQKFIQSQRKRSEIYQTSQEATEIQGVLGKYEILLLSQNCFASEIDTVIQYWRIAEATFRNTSVSALNISARIEKILTLSGIGTIYDLFLWESRLLEIPGFGAGSYLDLNTALVSWLDKTFAPLSLEG